MFIIAEVSEIARDGALKTQIMYGANLSFTDLNDYLRFMLKIGLLEKIVRDNKKVYKTTEKGLDLLERYRQITELLHYESQDVMKCPRCQEDVSSDYKFCPYCGKGLEIRRVLVKTR